jgi:transcription antitermination factor NusG
MSKCQWHVIYTYPHFEKKIFGQLFEKNIDAFLPCQKTVKQWRDRKKTVEIPLFPNYIFVNISTADRHKVFVEGVTRFISFDGKPAIVPDKEIDVIKKLSQNNCNVNNESYYNKGDKVRVVAGPLAGLEGMLLDIKGKSRVSIRFNSIAQAVSIDIQSSLLEKI